MAGISLTVVGGVIYGLIEAAIFFVTNWLALSERFAHTAVAFSQCTRLLLNFVLIWRGTDSVDIRSGRKPAHFTRGRPQWRKEPRHLDGWTTQRVRAGFITWLGRTQDEIASAMGISRQSAQRLVSLAVAEKLIKVRLDHPIAACLELANQLRKKFDLKHVEIVPSDPGSSSRTVGIAEAAAAEIERWLRRPDPIVLAVGTGRTLKAAVDQLPTIECPNHRIVSLTGNITPDGFSRLLQRHLQHGGCGEGAALPDAAAGARHFGRGA